jgi:hypothetical protein
MHKEILNLEKVPKKKKGTNICTLTNFFSSNLPWKIVQQRVIHVLEGINMRIKGKATHQKKE